MRVENAIRAGASPEPIDNKTGVCGSSPQSPISATTSPFFAYLNGVELDLSRPGKPTDNAFIEASNRRLREECLNETCVLSLEDARGKVETWWQEYTRNDHIARWAI